MALNTMRTMQLAALTVGFSLMGLPTVAEQSSATAKSHNRKARKLKNSAPPIPSGAAQRIAVDAASGELIESPAATSNSGIPIRSSPVPTTAPDGTISVTLGPEQMVYSVATKNPDGSVSISHGAGQVTETGKQGVKDSK